MKRMMAFHEYCTQNKTYQKRLEWSGMTYLVTQYGDIQHSGWLSCYDLRSVKVNYIQ